MEKIKLENNGLEVSALGLGCMGLTFGYGPLRRVKQKVLTHQGNRYPAHLQQRVGK